VADLRVGPFLFGFAGAGLAPPAHTLSETLPGPLSLDVCSGEFRARCVPVLTGKLAILPLPVGARLAVPARSRGAKPRQLEWHLGDKVRVRSDRIDLMRKRVEFALVAQP